MCASLRESRSQVWNIKSDDLGGLEKYFESWTDLKQYLLTCRGFIAT